MTVEVEFPVSRGPRYHRVDRDMLHAYLWRHAGPKGLVPFKGYELAEMLAIDGGTMSICFRQMGREGRIFKQGYKVFVVDPTLWRWEYTSEVAAAKIVPQKKRKASGGNPRPVRHAAKKGRKVRSSY